MKRMIQVSTLMALSYLVCAFFATAALAQQGWVAEKSGTTQDLYAAAFPDSTLAVAVGYGGLIITSTDGGVTWTARTSGTPYTLHSVSFPTPLIGTAVGNNGTVIRTTDGGKTWVGQTSGTTQDLESVSFCDSSNGMATGTGGTIIHTTNGGATWIAESDSSSAGIASISLASPKVGYIIAPTGPISFYGYGAQVIKTTDAGLTWHRVYAQGEIFYNAVAALDTNNAFAVGMYATSGGSSFYTTTTSNGGASWSNFSGWGNAAETLQLSAACYAGGIPTAVGSDGAIYRGTTLQSSGTYTNLYGVAFANGNLGIAVGPAGLLLRTTNGGIAPPPAPTLITPSNGATNVSTSPQISFNSNWVQSYHVQIATDSTFTNVVYDKSTYLPFHTGAPQQWPVSGLALDTRYYWHATATNAYGTSQWSQVSSFTTEGTPDLVVYDTTLKSPWSDVSWGGTVTYTDTNAISVASDAWGALSLLDGSWSAQDSVNPSMYTSLNFSFMGNQQFGVFLQTDSGTSLPCVDTTLSGSGWINVSIPMKELDPNGNYFSRLTFQSDEGSPYQFYVTDLRFVGLGQTSAAAKAVTPLTSVSQEVPKSFGLSQNYPNPFNPTTAITYQLSAASKVTLKVYDVLGREVATLVNGEESEGTHSVTFDGSRLASGVYLYRLTAGNHVFIKKMLELK